MTATTTADAAPGTTATRRFPCLDGIRAVAALLVVLTHVGARTGRNEVPGLAGALLHQAGALGVSMFFALSGFLLYRPFVAAHLAGNRPPGTAAYLRRRLLRIVPAYWLALTAALFVFASVDVPDSGAGDVLLYYGFGQTYTDLSPLGGLPQAWTLCVEMAFYLVLPLFAFAVRHLVTRRAGVETRFTAEVLAVVAVMTFSVMFRWFVLITRPHELNPLNWLPALADWFAVGMLLAVVSAWAGAGGRLPSVLRRLGDHPWLAVAAAAELVWMMTWLDLPRGIAAMGGVDHMLRNLLFAGVAALVLTVGVVGDQHRGAVRAFLGSRPVRFLGTISYGVFLWHVIVLREVADALSLDRTWGGFATLLAVTVPVTVGVAWTSWVLVERPLLRAKDRSLARTARQWLGAAPATARP